jgi:S-DNA-T family DNA segregation ATPase FtsK/SpoIIIE
VELPLFNDIPHLIVPSVRDKAAALDELERLRETANKRLFLLEMARKKTFEEYNGSLEEPLPRIVVIIDEFMSLMDRRGKTDAKFTEIISHLAATTRQTGIHLVLSTQRPSSSIISREISEAIPHRVSFYVMSGVESRIAINQTGAQRLLGEGDMIYADINSEKGTHAQAALITDAEIDRVIRFCNGQMDFGI